MTRLTLTPQIGSFWLVYETDPDTFRRVGNWDCEDDEWLTSRNGARRWVRSRYWPNVVEIVEQGWMS